MKNTVYSLVYDSDNYDLESLCDTASQLTKTLPEGSSILIMPRVLQLEELTLKEATRLKAFLEEVIFEKINNKEAV